jgi:hypothetical protein
MFEKSQIIGNEESIFESLYKLSEVQKQKQKRMAE